MLDYVKAIDFRQDGQRRSLFICMLEHLETYY